MLCIASGWIPHSSSSYHYHAFRWGDMFQRLQRSCEHSVCQQSIVRLPTEFMGMGRKNFQTNPHDVCLDFNITTVTIDLILGKPTKTWNDGISLDDLITGRESGESPTAWDWYHPSTLQMTHQHYSMKLFLKLIAQNTQAFGKLERCFSS